MANCSILPRRVHGADISKPRAAYAGCHIYGDAAKRGEYEKARDEGRGMSIERLGRVRSVMLLAWGRTSSPSGAIRIPTHLVETGVHGMATTDHSTMYVQLGALIVTYFVVPTQASRAWKCRALSGIFSSRTAPLATCRSGIDIPCGAVSRCHGVFESAPVSNVAHLPRAFSSTRHYAERFSLASMDEARVQVKADLIQ